MDFAVGHRHTDHKDNRLKQLANRRVHVLTSKTRHFQARKARARIDGGQRGHGGHIIGSRARAALADDPCCVAQSNQEAGLALDRWRPLRLTAHCFFLWLSDRRCQTGGALPILRHHHHPLHASLIFFCLPTDHWWS